MNVGYILNLSASFNANNFLYYFLPGISSGRILLFEKLTARTLTLQTNRQQEDILEKVRAVKEDWDFKRLSTQEQTDKINIHIVLDQSDWKFANFGVYNTFAFVKLHMLKGIFNKVFTAEDLKGICFRYFILTEEENETEKIANFLDAQGGWKGDKLIASFARENTSTLSWPDGDAIIQKINRLKIPTESLPTESHITGTQQKELDTFLHDLLTELKSGFALQENSIFPFYLGEGLNHLKADFQVKIRKVGDLSNPALILDVVKNFFKRFSSQYYLRSRNDLLFYVNIHARNNQKKIQSYDKFSAFLTESIAFFAQNEPIDFVNNVSDARKNQIQLEEIIIDDDARKILLEQYFTRRETCRERLKGGNADEVIVELVDLKTARFSVDEFKWNEDQIAFFQNINGLKDRIPTFFTREKADEIEQILSQNTIQPLEDALRAKREQTNIHLTERAYSDRQTLRMNSSEARMELERLRKEEASQNLSSVVDVDKYEKAKSEHKKTTALLYQRFLESLYLLPKKQETRYFYLISFVLIFLLISPLYTFKFWKYAFAFSIVFTLFIAIIGFVILGVTRSKILKNYNAIFLENVKLFQSLDEYRKSMEKLFGDVRMSSLRRKNIQALEAALFSVEEQKRKYSIHEDYYDKIIRQIESNGTSVAYTNERAEIIFQISPEYNFRRSPHLDKKLKIINGSSENEYSNVISQLGIITLINFKTKI